MRRPLLGACLLFVGVMIVYQLCVPIVLPDYSHLEGQSVCLSGVVTAMETREYFGSTQIVYTLKWVELIESMAETSEDVYEHNQIYCYTSKTFEHTYIGTKIAVKGDFSSFKEPENPGEFDEKTYYHILDVGGKIQKAQLLFSDGATNMFQQALYEIRVFFVQKIESLFSEPYAGIIETILLGYKANLDADMKQLYKEGGILHIMTISGMHIGMIGMACFHFLKRLKISTKLSAVFGVLIVFCYGMMVGMQASTFRAVFMFSIHMLSQIRGRSYDALTALGLASVLLLCKQPMYLFHSGFLLSFGSVLGILMVFPVLSKHFVLKKKFWCSLHQKFLASISILLVTLPIQVYFFYEYSLYSVLLNLIVLPLLPYIVGIAAFMLFIPVSWTFLTVPFVLATEKMLWMYEWLCTFCGKLPYHTIIVGAPKLWQIAVYYVCIFVCVWLISRFRKWEIKKRSVLLFVVPILLCGMIVLVTRPLKGFRCHFLSVGQGDCVLVQYDNRAYLVDCGSSSKKAVAEDVLLPYLKYYGISELDGVFLSHADTDHINGIIEWLQDYTHSHVHIKSFILPKLEETHLETEFKEILRLAKAHDISVFMVACGDKIELGEVCVEVLSPDVKMNNSIIIDANEASQVLLWKYQGYQILMLGDVGMEMEEKISNMLLEGKITVLKVAHHGSKYSSGASFLARTNPVISVLSYGKGNAYGHPHKETIKRLRTCGTTILETPETGCITIQFKQNDIKIKTFKNKAIP